MKDLREEIKYVAENFKASRKGQVEMLALFKRWALEMITLPEGQEEHHERRELRRELIEKIEQQTK